MEQFSKVVQQLRAWLISHKFIAMLYPYRLILLLGGLGINFFYQLLVLVIPIRFFGVYKFIHFVFSDIPLITIAHFAFLLGIWLTLVSKDVKLVSFALWINVFLILFPFRSFNLSTLITVAIYAYLGYLVFKYADSDHGKQVANEQFALPVTPPVATDENTTTTQQ